MPVPRRKVDTDELLAASLANQHLLARVPKARVMRDLCGLQAQFANNPGHALRIRAADFTPDGWSGGLVKTWTHRCTLHAVPEREVGLYVAARGFARHPWNDDWGIDARIKPRWSAFILDCLARGSGGRAELKDACRKAGMEESVLANVFHGWGGLLREMCERGLIAYHGGTEKRFVRCRPMEFPERDAARAEIVKRYFTNLGPATPGDCAAFTGYGMKTLAELMRRHPLPLRSAHAEGREYFYLGAWPKNAHVPDCVYLAGFDSLVMAYRDRSRFLDPRHKAKLVTNTGIVFPAVMLNGRLRARWKKDGTTLRVSFFEKSTRRQRDMAAAKGRELFGGEIDTVAFLDLPGRGGRGIVGSCSSRKDTL